MLLPARIYFCIIFILIAIFIIPLLHSQNNKITVTSEIRELEDFLLRSIFRFSYTKSFFIIENNELNAAGFACPWFKIGPFIRLGLLKEIYNPLAYSVGSNVFGEITDLRLNCSFIQNSYRGLVLSPVPDCLSFYYLNDNKNFPQMGAYFNIGITDYLKTTLLINTSKPEADSKDDVWFYAKPIFPGARIFHLASRLNIKMKSYILCFTSALAMGKLVLPGIFSHISIKYDNDLFIWKILGAIQSRSYVDPYGDYDTKRLSFGGELGFFLFNCLLLKGRYQKTSYNGEEIFSLLDDGKEVWAVKGRLVFLDNSDEIIFLTSEYTKTVPYKEDEYDKISVEFTFGNEWLRCKPQYSHKGVCYGEWENTGNLNIVLYIDFLTIESYLKISQEQKNISFFGSLKFIFKFENHKIYLKVFNPRSFSIQEKNPLPYFSLTLGWQGSW